MLNRGVCLILCAEIWTGSCGAEKGMNRCAWEDAIALRCWQETTPKKAFRNFWKSQQKVIFGWDKCGRVKVNYKTNAGKGG